MASRNRETMPNKLEVTEKKKAAKMNETVVDKKGKGMDEWSSEPEGNAEGASSRDVSIYSSHTIGGGSGGAGGASAPPTFEKFS